MREIVQLGDPVLRARAAEVDALEPHRALLDEMVETMREAPGVGLAAPQVGEPLRLVVLEDPPELHAAAPAELLAAQGRRAVPLQRLANPTVEPVGDEQALFFEGCLSFSGWLMLVPRWRRVRVTALGVEPFVAEGWFARILQHECDHLDGTLCVDRADTRTIVSAESYRDRWRHVPMDEARRRLSSR